MLKISNYVQRLKKRYRTKWVEDLPDNIEKNTIYIIGGRKYPFYAAITCPKKRCKKIIHLEISPDSVRKWEVQEHKNETLTLNPSIFVTKHSCKCHYWIREGRVVWCEMPPFFVPKENLIP